MATSREFGREPLAGRPQPEPRREPTEPIRETMGEARERAEGVKDRMMGRARSAMEGGKSRAADRIEQVGETMERRAETLETRGGMGGQVGRIMHRAGDALESGAQYLRTHEIATMRDDVSTQIREHPFMSVGVALGTGFVLGRVFGGGEEENEKRIDRLERKLQWRERELEQAREQAGGMRGQVGRALGTGLSMLVARQVRNRISGR
ncbi:MAG TPA: hypothetical protein VF212_08210 [Longimicrobiales bacterium]